MAATRATGFLGRTSEREVLDRLLANVRGGQSAVLVIRGEAGIGKTALLRYAARQAAGFHVAQVTGVQAEMELPFAGIHLLCAPMLDRLDTLPAPQRDAASVALGLASGQVPDRFMVGLAVLGLLSATAAERPLLCLVEDAQWLDAASSQVLGFVARRVLAESVAIVIALREPTTGRDFDGLPELALEGLHEQDARTLLSRTVPGRLDDRVGDRIVAETRGNPLALVELPRRMTAAQLAGGFELPNAAELPAHIEDQYLQSVAELPEATQRLILLAAADPVGDATLVWRAARRLGIERSALAAATDAQLVDIAERVRFRHPLVRSAVYRAASPADRRSVHEALAELNDPVADADRRAWHRALAAAGPDEDVAAELEHSAGRAQMRGGLAAAAAFLERAAGLTVDPARRAGRALAAAQAKHQAGAPDAALALLARAEAGSLDPLQRAQVDLLRAEIAYTTNRGRDAPPLLLRAAKQLEPLDVSLARDTYLQALMATQLAGRFASGAPLEVAKAAREAPKAPSPPRVPDLLLDGFALIITEGHSAGAPLVKRALSAFRDGDVGAGGDFRWLILAEVAALEVWDHDTFTEVTVRELQLVRDAGALTVLATSLSAHIIARVFAGELAAAALLLDEQKIVTEASGGRLAAHAALVHAAWRGREAELSALVEATLKEVVPRGEGIGLSLTQWGKALLYNGLGQYERALAAAEELMEPPRKFDQTVGWGLGELTEAAARSGHDARAHDALRQLSELTRAAGTDWSLGVEARCRALLSEPAAAEDLYREAIERLGRTRLRGEHARAHLVYGEWLRRGARRVDAREQLRTAHRMFNDMGMEAFAERARRELLATGETVRTGGADTREELTPQEKQIARLARDGLTNAEIGGQLFLSPRTVEWHLHHVFGKLGIRSRQQLARALGAFDSAGVPT